MMFFENPVGNDHGKFVRRIFQICFSLLLCGCSVQTEILSRPVNQTSPYGPDAYKDGREAEPQQYRTDRDLCFKQVQSQTDLAMTESTNITKFRKCLVSRGYLLVG